MASQSTEIPPGDRESPPIEPRSSEITPDVVRDDADSAIGQDAPQSTASLSESILAYRTLHGRTYQSHKTAEYWAPNDDQQNDGLDLLHHGLLNLLDGKLFLAPIAEKPDRILDVGTGTGIWAIDVADEFPATQVIGTDISPIQPGWVPPNLSFEIDDMNLPWTWPENHFDFVHLRVLYGCVTDWQSLYQRALHHLKPGGWVQDFEMDTRLESDHVKFEEQAALDQWAALFIEAGEKTGRSFDIARDHRMKERMEAAGFVDVAEKKIKMPCGEWPKDERLKQTGLYIHHALLQSLDGLPYLLGEMVGWSREEVAVLVAKVRKEVRRIQNFSYVTTTVVYGRKPLAEKLSD